MIFQLKRLFKYKITWLVFLVMLIVSVVYHFGNRNSDLDKRDDRLIVVCEPGHFGFYRESGSFRGFQYELVKAFANAMNMELQISEDEDFEESLQQLQDGEIDLLVGYIPLTRTIQEKVLASDPWFVSHMVLVQKKGENLIQDAGLLDGKTILIPSASAYGSRVSHLSDEIAGNIQVVRIENSTESILDSLSADMPGLSMCLENQVPWLKNGHPELDFSLSLGFSQEFCWLLAPGKDQLQSKLNRFMEDFRTSDEYKLLMKNY